MAAAAVQGWCGLRGLECVGVWPQVEGGGACEGVGVDLGADFGGEVEEGRMVVLGTVGFVGGHFGLVVYVIVLIYEKVRDVILFSK